MEKTVPATNETTSIEKASHKGKSQNERRVKHAVERGDKVVVEKQKEGITVVFSEKIAVKNIKEEVDCKIIAYEGQIDQQSQRNIPKTIVTVQLKGTGIRLITITKNSIVKGTQQTHRWSIVAIT